MPDRRSVDMCDDSIALAYGILDVISYDIITVAIVVVDCFTKCIFSPEYAICSMFLLVDFCGVPIQSIKVILGLIISILLIITSNYHSRPL